MKTTTAFHKYKVWSTDRLFYMQLCLHLSVFLLRSEGAGRRQQSPSAFCHAMGCKNAYPTHAHTHVDTQDIQHAGSRKLVRSNSCSGHCAPGKAGACWIFHYSLIYCLTNPVITESKLSSHIHTHPHTCTQNTHLKQQGCQAWQICLFDPSLLNKRGEIHE